MRDFERTLHSIAPTDATVLICGESGVGKEIVSRALHLHSPRRDRPFVKVNCAALPFDLLESELFGYERGAFTGAHRAKPGKFELGHTGTVFLDEIAEVPPAIQAKLLQVLQDGQFSRLGSRKDVRVDVRVVAATNKDLEALVERGAFRADLYYRLNVVGIHVPPLRERRSEIGPLVETFLAQYTQRYARPRPVISPRTVRLFMEYPWPGNIRELENTVKRMVVLGDDAAVAAELGARMSRRERYPALPAGPAASNGDLGPGVDDLYTDLGLPGPTDSLRDIARRAARDAERQALQHVLERVRWNRSEAARLLKVNYKTLLQKIDGFGLAEKRPRRSA
jgi:two-component system response regulator AtoC